MDQASTQLFDNIYVYLISEGRSLYILVMDVGAFSGEDFDAKDWVNSCFQQPEAQANKEQFASSLVMKLQVKSLYSSFISFTCLNRKWLQVSPLHCWGYTLSQ